MEIDDRTGHVLSEGKVESDGTQSAASRIDHHISDLAGEIALQDQPVKVDLGEWPLEPQYVLGFKMWANSRKQHISSAQQFFGNPCAMWRCDWEIHVGHIHVARLVQQFDRVHDT